MFKPMPGAVRPGFTRIQSFDPKANVLRPEFTIIPNFLAGILFFCGLKCFEYFNFSCACLPETCILANCKVGRGPDDKKNADMYIARTRRLIMLEAAAEAWASGVPWNDALALSEHAIDKANALLYPLGRPKAKPRSKAKPKAMA